MTKILSGKDVAMSIDEKTICIVEELKECNFVPKLGILQFKVNDGDLSYIRSIKRKAELLGIDVECIDMENPNCIPTAYEIESCGVHGFLTVGTKLANQECYVGRDYFNQRDIDSVSSDTYGVIYGLTNLSIENGLFHIPCTAEACIRILKYYKIPITGRHIVILGRSYRVGKPLAMALSAMDATVTICHSKSNNISTICKNADIIVSAIGKANFVNEDFLSPKQTAIDVGINIDETGKLCGDVSPVANGIVRNLTPVPGGVGLVTTSVLMRRVAQSARSIFYDCMRGGYEIKF